MKNDSANPSWKILLIDDDEEDYIITKEMLIGAKGRKIQLQWAASYQAGREALLADDYYDAVLVDYDMGAHSGIDLIREAVQRDFPAPFILFTGRGNYEVDVEAMQAGASLYLTKGEVSPLLLERSIGYAIERRQTEAKLRLSEEKFSIIFDRSPTPTFLLSLPDTRFVDVNQSFLDLLGFTRDELIGQTAGAVGISRSEENRVQALAVLSEKGLLDGIESRIYTKTGQLRIASANLQEIHIDGEHYLLGIAQDITEQRQTEAALRASEAALRSSEALLREKELPIHNDAGVVGDDVNLHEEAPIATETHPETGTLHSEVTLQGETARRSNGVPSRSSAATTASDEEPVTARGVEQGRGEGSADFDAQLADDQALKDMTSRFQAILENALDVAYRRDLHTDRYDYVSPVVEQILGFSVDEMKDMTIAQTLARIHAEDRPVVEADLARAFVVGSGRLGYRFKAKDGQYRWLADYITVTRGADGLPRYQTGILRDVTDQVHAEQALRESEERFQLASRAVTGVLYDWSLSRDELYQSEGLERVVGYKPGEEPGGSRDWWPRNIHPDDYPHVTSELQAAIAGQTESFNYEYRIRHRDGHWVNIWDQGYIVRDENGQAQRVVGMCADITDRVQTEEALRASEAAMEAFFEASPGVLNLFDDQLRYIKCDPLTPTYFGLDRQSIKGKSVFDLNPIFAEKVLAPLLRKVTETGRPILNTEIEGPVPSRGGEIGYFHASYFPVPLPGGKIGLGVIAVETTEIKRAERALRESEERLRDFLDKTNDSFFILDHDWRFKYVNRHFTETIGVPAEDLLGAPVYDKLPKYVGTQIHEQCKKVMQERVSVNCNLQGLSSNAWYEVSIYPTGDGISIFAVDRTQEKNAQNLLQSAYARLKFYVDANIIGVVISREDGSLIEVNDYYLNLLGYTREEFEAGKIDWLNTTPTEYLPADEAAFADLQARGICSPYEKEYIRKDGSRVWVYLNDAFLPDGTIASFVLDLTELKQAQAALEDYTEKLRQSNEELEQFAFVASHDLQEPLRKISMFGATLQRHMTGKLDSDAQDYLDRMLNAAERMQAMISGLLELSRVNTHGSNFAPIDLTQLAEEVRSDLEPRIRAAGGQVQVIGPLPTIEADELQMRQLFQNLIGNAIKFTRPDVAPLVRVSAEITQDRKQRMVAIRVEDNGIGFDPSQADKLFQPFQRLHSRSKYEGSGLGLAICQKIVARHNGKIEVHSTPGVGTTFIIYLPVMV